MSLISKITEKLKKNTTENLKKKTTKAVASVALASALALSGCSGLASIFNPNSGQTNNPNNDNQTQIGGDGSTTTPEEDDRKFSQITYNLMENKYYETLMDNFSSSASGRDSQIYDPIPYGFLQNEGFNIDRIKNDELECDSMPYRKDGEENNLYIALRVETDAQTPYYTCYTLKYELSDKELSDVNRLHRYEYFEAPLFIQELSYQKTPVVESEASMTIDCYNRILNSIVDLDRMSTDVFGTNDLILDIINFSKTNNELNFIVRPRSYRTVFENAEMRLANTVPVLIGDDVRTTNGNIYTGPSVIDFSSDEAKENYMSNPISVSYYSTQYEHLLNYFRYDYELYYSNE